MVFEEDNVLKFAVKRLTDPGQLCSIAFKEIWECRREQWQSMSSVIETIKKLKERDESQDKSP